MHALARRLVRLCSLLCLPLTGCVHRATVSYQSDPPGALIYQGGRSLGNAPVSRTYPLSEEERARGWIQVEGGEARWASGATATLPAQQIDLRIGPRLVTFVRPAEHPNLEADMRFALELAQTRALERSAKAAEKQAEALSDAAYAAQQAADAAARKERREEKEAARRQAQEQRDREAYYKKYYEDRMRELEESRKLVAPLTKPAGSTPSP